MYSISKDISTNKIFLVNRKETEGRLDAYFYKQEFQILDQRFNNSKYDVVPFREIIISINNGYDFRDYKADGTPYIKVANVKPGEFDFNKMQYIEFDSSKISKNIQLKQGNILLTRKGTYGNALSLDKDFNYVISSEVFYIELNQSKINSKYLEIFFNSNVGQKQFLRHSIGAIMGSLSQEAIKNLKIPLPSLPIQKEIVTIYNKAYQEKLKKEQKAKKLLEGLDIYLLEELGIKLPVKDNSLVNRINKEVSLRDITGGRFDPMLYDKNTIALRKSIIDINPTRFKKVQLKNLVIRSITGDWGLDEEDLQVNKDYQKCLVIRATEFDNNFNLNIENSRVKYRMIKKEKLKKIDIKVNDLLIEKSGGSPDQPVGRIAIIDKEIFEENKLCYSNFIHKIRVDNEIINPSYLFNFLKTIHNIKLTESMQSQTNGIRNLIMSNYFNQYIILPLNERNQIDMSKQEQISEKINSMRNEAKKLQKEAIEVLQNAKIEVEKIILG